MVKDIHLIDVTDFRLPDGTGSSEWFREAFDTLGLVDGYRLVVHDGPGCEFPDVGELKRDEAGVMISGSYGPVWMERDWIGPLFDFIRLLHRNDIWLLGVCFGHQAIAAALGGEVSVNSRGREMGTEMIHLTPEGEKSPLLAGLGQGTRVNIMHLTHVTRMPEGAVRLAYNRMTPVQAFRLGRSFGYQPHPEFTPRQLRQLVDMFAPVLVRREGFVEDEGCLEDLKASFMDTPESMSVLGNFCGIVSSG
ncbi:MAG TPA: type 1 glutamine amidotransferase [Candidatus Krumholzibacterium sp.]|nr:type 1 glutamine amidotransferase [Candidatus Krumholzibacterium sp.]